MGPKFGRKFTFLAENAVQNAMTTIPIPDSGEPVRARLYDATESSHAALDAKLVPLFDQGLKGYCEFLRISAQGVLTLERALEEAAVGAILPDWAERSRTKALHADMASLGIAPPPVMDVRLPRDEAYLYGVLYVLEGSRVGGKLLARRIDESADSRIRAATQYLRQGEGVDMWRTFLARLEASEAVKAAPDRAIRGARAAFAAFDPGIGSIPRPLTGR